MSQKPRQSLKHMYTNQNQNLYAAQLNFSKETQNQVELETPTQSGITMPTEDLVFYLGSLGLIAVWLASFFLLLKKVRINNDKNESRLDIDRLKRVPCKNCQYFSGNFYLKCAVRPDDVLTKRATDCSDYWPQDDNQSQ